MKTFSILSSWLLASGFWQIASAQNTTTPDKQNMQVTTQDAFYPKGEQALYAYIMYNTKYSQDAIKNYVTGSVELSFDVMPDSSIKNVKVISDVGYGVGDAVKVMVEQLKFAPAIQMGMRVKMNLIMDFPVKAH
ncbi:MAG: energy transducer TonB [Bacteroidetes bacterium]|nr:energy transducer TonB [Bacteroidota bacterium]